MVTLAAGALASYVIRRILLLVAHRTSLTEQEVGPVYRVVRWLTDCVAFLVILSAFGVNLGRFWGILSTVLAKLAIGFVAVWSVLSNVPNNLFFQNIIRHRHAAAPQPPAVRCA